MIKPLKGKAYGSIPHLPGSKYGDKRDQGISPEAAVHFTTKPKQPGDTVYVTEKLDGSCVCVAKTEDDLLEALIRAGYRAQSSPWRQHQWFANWAMMHCDEFDRLLKPGERVCGEWLAQAHGTRYDLQHRSPFAAFDIIRGQERESYEHFFDRCHEAGLSTVPIVSWPSPISIDEVMRIFKEQGSLYGAEKPEGAVWRIERGGRFKDIAKYVRPDHIVGGLLPEQSGGEDIWNWRPQ
jgi:hypothetical protein